MEGKFKIAFFGSSLVSAYWNGAATYYRGIIKYLNRLGHEITFYEPDAFERQLHRDMPDPSWAEVVVYPAEEEQVHKMLARAADADILVKASGVGVFDELLEREVAAQRQPHQKAIFWDVDAPATLGRMEKNPEDPFWKTLPDYDLVLTYGGGDPVVEKYTQYGAAACIPVYNALDPETHYPVSPDPRFRAKLGFLGNRLPDREKRVEEFFERAARLLPGEKFLLGGNGWQNKGLPANVTALGHVYTADHNAFNCTADAVLNVSRDSMASNGFSPATRVFEAAGAGACIITDYWKGIENFLEPGREVLVAHNGEEVADLLRTFSPDQMKRIGEAAHHRVLEEHTYAHRARQVQSILKKMTESIPA